jgi:uncharacterized membrane protein YeaQ/YmgE (transglycosylase-associated protein family)
MIWFVISLMIIGIIAGYLARLFVPGPDPMSFIGTMVLGIIGSFVGGFLGWAIFGRDLDQGALQPPGIIGSVIGAVIVLLIYNAMNRSGARGRCRV